MLHDLRNGSAVHSLNLSLACGFDVFFGVAWLALGTDSEPPDLKSNVTTASIRKTSHSSAVLIVIVCCIDREIMTCSFHTARVIFQRGLASMMISEHNKNSKTAQSREDVKHG